MPKAVVCEHLSKSAVEGIESLAIKDVPKLDLGPADVRIAAKSASINFPELLMMQGKYQYKPSIPFVLCSEGAGVVAEIGSDVRKFTVGERVFFSSGTNGAASEDFVIAEQGNIFSLPAALSFSQGAGFLMGYTTAYHGLVTRGDLKAGEWLMVTGAAGGMGIAAIQLGKALGANVIAAASSDGKLEVCKQVGADATVNYGSDVKTLKKQVAAITNGALCDVIYDVVGGDVFDECCRCVSPMGYARLLVVGFASGRIPALAANMALIKGFSLVGVRMGAQVALQPGLMDEMTARLLDLASQGKLLPYVGAEFPLQQAKKAFELMERRSVLGKACIVFEGSKL